MMDKVIPELHRPVPTDRIGPQALENTVNASASERAALAQRLGIPAILRLRCHFWLTSGPGATFEAAGHLQARVVRSCVLTLDEFEAEVEERFRLRFVPSGTESDDPDPELEDEVAYEGGVLDLGEAAAEQLALALDPYPRKPGATLPVGDATEPEHPFAALAALKRPH